MVQNSKSLITNIGIKILFHVMKPVSEKQTIKH